MEAFNFTVANEDCNLYTYDMRKLTVASCLHQVPCHIQRDLSICRLELPYSCQEGSSLSSKSTAAAQQACFLLLFDPI